MARLNDTGKTQEALNNAYLKAQGYMRCAMEGASFTMPSETPCAGCMLGVVWPRVRKPWLSD